MRKFLTVMLALLTVTVTIFVIMQLRKGSQPALKPSATFDPALYQKFLAAEEAGDYVAMNAAFDSNIILTGVGFSDDYDPTHGGLIYTYPFSVTVSSKEKISGKLFVVSEKLDRKSQSVGANDYFAVDRRTAADPEVVVMDSYRADTDALIKRLCQLLLEHEAAHPTDWERTEESMVSEWKMHNLSYAMGYKVERSMHVNLNNADEGTDWFRRAMEEFK